MIHIGGTARWCVMFGRVFRVDVLGVVSGEGGVRYHPGASSQAVRRWQVREIPRDVGDPQEGWMGLAEDENLFEQREDAEERLRRLQVLERLEPT